MGEAIRSTRQGGWAHIDLAMNLKTLRKKISKLEIRLREGPQKLARLKRKLAAVTAAKASKAKRKSAARAVAARRIMKASAPTQKQESPSKSGPQTKAAVAQKQPPARKAKRKLNLSPERRAQLAAAMKARWAAKRAAADANQPQSSTNGESAG
jgi:predicted  nucleic acid-binding Zn-ribbon protein